MGSMTDMSVRRSRNFRCVPTSLKLPIFNLEEKRPPRPFGIILCYLELLNCLPDNNLKIKVIFSSISRLRFFYWEGLRANLRIVP